MTGVEHQMQITPSSGLAPDEIDLLIMEAETSVEKDRAAKEFILKRNKLESLVKNTRKAMTEFGKSLPLEEQQDINGDLNDAEDFLKSPDEDDIEEFLLKVETSANRLTEALMATV